ncbi:Ig-like domain-containing protein [Reinekea sp. G2M2-21]|uniref:Ig-like domain-containing protein n=1 Tax=Reinekea sp. G2M2-21 TaxID=2788942 RepID=UPI0018AB43C5|nr:Ig-like domain-containing protein [Reinekea sp. G2M2-21]
MRLFSLFFAMLMLFSACQPINVTSNDGNGVKIEIQANATLPTEITPETVIEVEFSQAIPAGTDLSPFFTISPAIEGDLVLASDGLSVTFTPEVPGWAPGVTYQIRVTDQVALATGDQFVAAQWSLLAEGWTDPAEQFATGGSVTGWDLATDSKGNVYVLAGAYGTEFDGQPLEYFNQVFIQKFKPSGEKLWTKRLDVGGNASGPNFHINGNDEIIVGLTVELPADDADGPLTNRAMVMALDSDGNAMSGYPWRLQSSDPTKWVTLSEMRVADSDDVYVRGQTIGSIDGSQTGNYYVAKFNQNGSLAWVNQFGGPTPGMRPIQMVLDVDGNAFLVLNGEGDFEGTTHTWACESFCQSGAIMKITAQGDIDWIERFGQDHVNVWSDAITLNAQGEILGGFEVYLTPENTKPDNTTLNGATLPTKNGMAMVRFDTNGNHLSTQPHGNAFDGGNWPTDLLLTDEGTLLGTGTYAGSTWEYEGWLAEWDAQGVLISERAFPGTSADGLELWALTIDPWGNVFVSGVQNYGADNNWESGLVVKKLSFD